MEALALFRGELAPPTHSVQLNVLHCASAKFDLLGALALFLSNAVEATARSDSGSSEPVLGWEGAAGVVVTANKSTVTADLRWTSGVPVVAHIKVVHHQSC